MGNGKFQAGIDIGPMFFLGDLGGNYGKGRGFIKDINLPLTNLSKGFFTSYYPTEWLGFRFAASHSKIEGYDSIINNKGSHESFRQLRNLQFRSPLTEATLVLEFYPTIIMEQITGLETRLKPYGVIGIGAFRFNPQGQYIEPNGNRVWVDLQPLRLEGQGMIEYPNRKPYNLTQFNIPMGVGMKYMLGSNMFIGMELLHRTTFTDYMDDVSTNYIDANLFRNYLTPQQATIARQLHYRENLANPLTRGSTPDMNEQRGNPKQNDAFFSTTVRLGWRFGNNNNSSNRTMRQLRCPIVRF
jgi:hypothetical protein